MKLKKVISSILAMLLVFASLAGCKKEVDEAMATASEVKLNGNEIYPVQCDDTLTYWTPLHVYIAQKYENYADTPIGKELKKLTGVNVEYVHAQQGQGAEQFNIMLASNDLPDMVQYDWRSYPGGPDAAVRDDIIYALSDKIKKYSPAYAKIMEENAELKKMVVTSNGDIYSYNFIRGEEWLCNYYGIIIRKDWLDKAGLDVPKSVAEFDNMLVKFKEFSGTAPLRFTSKMFPAFMFNTCDNFYVDNNGKIAFGAIDSQYKKALTQMKDWYDRGLLHPDFASMDSNSFNAAVLNGKLGVFDGAVGGGIATYLNANNDPDFDLMGITQITENGDDIAEFSYTEAVTDSTVASSITKNCKNIELAMRYLDFGYTEKGHMLYNFGVEGESYNVVNGEPQFTDLMKNNPEGKTFAELSPLYLKASYNGTFVQDARYVEESVVYPQQREAYANWSKTNMQKHLVPPFTLLEDEIDRAGDIKASISTYVDEMYIKFVTGRESLDKYDEYVAQVEKLGLNEILDIYQKALDRYNQN